MLTLAPLPATAATAAPTSLAGSFTTPVDASPADARAALDAQALATAVLRPLRALGADHRLALAPSPVAPTAGATAALAMVWRFDGAPAHGFLAPAAFASFAVPGHVKVRWDLAVRPAAEGGSLLSIRTRFEPTDHAARERLRAAWALLGPLADSMARRAAAAVKAAAEEEEA